MKTYTAQGVAIISLCVLAAEGWPMVIAIRLGSAVVRVPFAVSSAMIVGRVVIAIGAVLAGMHLVRARPPSIKLAVRTGLVNGAASATLLLALMSYYRDQGSLLAFSETLVGGILYAGPVGAFVGGVLGASLGLTHIAVSRCQLGSANARLMGRAAILATSALAHLAVAILSAKALRVDWFAATVR